MNNGYASIDGGTGSLADGFPRFSREMIGPDAKANEKSGALHSLFLLNSLEVPFPEAVGVLAQCLRD